MNVFFVCTGLILRQGPYDGLFGIYKCKFISCTTIYLPWNSLDQDYPPSCRWYTATV